MTTKLQRLAIGTLGVLSFAAAVAAAAPLEAAPGWRPRYRWHAGYWYPGPSWLGHSWACGYCGWGAPAAAATAYAYGPIYYGGCYWQSRPVYDAWGNFAGYVPVQACY